MSSGRTVRTPKVKHWLIRYDPDDGEPYGTVCDCDIGEDHDGDGNPVP
jgi:hypothetical protein